MMKANYPKPRFNPPQLDSSQLQPRIIEQKSIHLARLSGPWTPIGVQ